MNFTARIRQIFSRPRYGATFIWAALVPATVALFLALNHKNVFENDVFLHTVIGQWILDGGSPAGSPDWTYGPFQPGWVNTMAVPEVVFALLYKWLSWGGLALVSILALPAFFWNNWYAITKLGPRPADKKKTSISALAYVMAVILTFLVMVVISVRPQAWSMVVTPIITIALVRIIHTGTFPRLLPLVLGTWVMANWHGYALLIAPSLALAAVIHLIAGVLGASRENRRAEFRRRFRRGLKGIPVTLAAFAVTLLTPAGLGVYTSALKIKEAATAIITEWQPTDWSNTSLRLLIAISVMWALAAFQQLYRLHPTKRQDGVTSWSIPVGLRTALLSEGLLIASIFIALGGVRRTAFLALVPMTIIATTRWMRRLVHSGEKDFKIFRRPSKRWVVTSISAVALVASLASVIHDVPGITVDKNMFPTKIATLIAEQPGQHDVFVDYNVSSAVMFVISEYAKAHHIPLAHRTKVSLDGRTDRYGKAILLKYEILKQATLHWEELWAYWDKATDVVMPEAYPLAHNLEDAGYTVMARELTGPTPDHPHGEMWVWLKAPASVLAAHHEDGPNGPTWTFEYAG
jgi:hypothetical protein